MSLSPRRDREASSRDAEAREVYDFEYRSTFHIDPAIVPAGWRYQWCTETVLGQYQRESLTRNQMFGWRPVPADRHPELVPPPLPGHDPEVVIRAGNHILMECREEKCAAYELWQRRQTAELTRSKDVEMGLTPISEAFPRTKPEISTEYLPA